MREQITSNALKTLISQNIPITTTIGKVKEVRDNVCDVERDDLPELIDVRFNAIETTLQNYFRVIPKVGSYVICGILNSWDAFIIQYSEIEKIEIIFNKNEILVNDYGISFNLDNGKFDIKNKEEDLKNS